ncbi:LysR family transcriptional regulator [Bradyrhizobium sp. NAS80.1]|uniref:LysR family transcriptional regulator n=1 Tax=Bradyrhizobium sp. NAS80.1 TaxID=1680159 RepID=UPI000A006747|nr:LysR family transcriptional regulator [Bradyrhizobium sp. NAS80.1]
MFDWQDLRHFIVLGRVGTLAGAARELGVDHATVGRRVTALESALGIRLIDRLPRSCPLTEEGLAISAIARRIEDAAEAIQRCARGSTSPLSGTVKVSAPPVVANCCIAPYVMDLHAAYPKLKLVLLATPGFVALGRGDADIALRLDRPTEKGSVGRKIGTMKFALYARTGYADRPANQWEFIAFDKALDQAPQQVWLRHNIGGRPIAFEASDLFGQQAAARAGLGIAVLPTLMGERDDALVRLSIESEPPNRELWMVTYPDVKRSKAVRVTMDFLANCAERNLPLRS